MSCTQRLFFTLTLQPQLARNIAHWRTQTFGELRPARPSPATQLHLTLAFLGDTRPAQCDSLCRIAARLHNQPFTLTLDNLGQWPKAGIIWLGPRNSPRALLSLAAALRAAAVRCGLPQPATPFSPHITLFRRAHHPLILPSQTPGWSVSFSHFSLYSSELTPRGSRYTELQRWSLGEPHAL